MRRAFQIVSLVCLAGLSLLYPWLESLDPWDSPEPSSDAEIQFIVLLTFVGIMFVLAHLLATLAVSSVLMQVLRQLKQSAGSAFRMPGFALAPLVSASPPVPLRI
jgi:hypothetical protein